MKNSGLAAMTAGALLSLALGAVNVGAQVAAPGVLVPPAEGGVPNARFAFAPHAGTPPPLLSGATLAVRVGVDIDSVRWEMKPDGTAGGSSSALAPDPIATVICPVGNSWDVELSLKHLGAKDDGDVSAWRIGLGPTIRAQLGGFEPYAGLQLCLFTGLSAERPDSSGETVKGDAAAEPGLRLAIGSDYVVSDSFALGFDLHYERLLGSADLGDDTELTLDAVGLGVTATFVF
jgi:hypothetical protein